LGNTLISLVAMAFSASIAAVAWQFAARNEEGLQKG
jgi:type II secretory pathway component PulJ